MRVYHPQKVLEFFMEILPYLKVTFSYVILALLMGILGGWIIMMMKSSRIWICKRIAEIYISIIRCTPAIVLLFLVNYGLPEILRNVFNINCGREDAFVFVVITLSMFSAASLSEVMRSAYEEVDKNQVEAALSVGIRPVSIFFHIILPQVAYYMLPNLGNTILTLLKEGALAYMIGVIDIMGRGELIIGKNQSGYLLETYTALFLIYWPLSVVIGKVIRVLERKLDFKTRTSKKLRIQKDEVIV